MSKLDKIKAELAKLLVKYAVVKTDNGVLEYTGEELVAEMDVFVTDENGEKVPATDGEYKTEDNKVITVENGKVASIVEIEEELVEEEPIEEPTEEPKEETEDVKDEEPKGETEEVVEEPKEDDKVVLEDVNESIAEIRKEIDELYKLVDSILGKIGETRDEADERLKKLECASQAKPAVEEFEALSVKKNTGNSKLDKFLNRYGK